MDITWKINWEKKNIKQNIKVKLATQLSNKSVTETLKFCKYNLNLPNFLKKILQLNLFKYLILYFIL